LGKLVYVLDDDENIRNIIEKFLMYEGFQVEKFRTGTDLLKAVELNKPDCFVIDIMLPDMSGFKVCQRIREDSNIPILFVSAKGEEMDRILGLEIGGDDYITKPFSGRELAVRVKALLRRSVNTTLMEDLGTFQIGNLVFKLDQREILGFPFQCFSSSNNPHTTPAVPAVVVVVTFPRKRFIAPTRFLTQSEGLSTQF